jgi:hypothetical protein
MVGAAIKTRLGTGSGHPGPRRLSLIPGCPAREPPRPFRPRPRGRAAVTPQDRTAHRGCHGAGRAARGARRAARGAQRPGAPAARAGQLTFTQPIVCVTPAPHGRPQTHGTMVSPSARRPVQASPGLQQQRTPGLAGGEGSGSSGPTQCAYGARRGRSEAGTPQGVPRLTGMPVAGMAGLGGCDEIRARGAHARGKGREVSVAGGGQRKGVAQGRRT